MMISADFQERILHEATPFDRNWGSEHTIQHQLWLDPRGSDLNATPGFSVFTRSIRTALFPLETSGCPNSWFWKMWDDDPQRLTWFLSE
jgi:hypothetical protein